MKTGTFEAMEQNEMMAMNGGARSKSARRAATKAARKNLPSRTQIAKAATIGAGVCLVGSGVCGVVGAATATAYCIGGSQIATGLAGIGVGMAI